MATMISVRVNPNGAPTPSRSSRNSRAESSSEFSSPVTSYPEPGLLIRMGENQSPAMTGGQRANGKPLSDTSVLNPHSPTFRLVTRYVRAWGFNLPLASTGATLAQRRGRMHVRGRAVAIGLALALVAAGFIIFSSFSSCGSSSSSSASSSAPSIRLGTIDPVRSVQTQDETLVVYELSILNSGETAVNLRQVDTTSGGNLLASYAGSALCERVSETSTQIDPGAELLVFMWLPLPTDLPNQTLTHVVTMQSADAESEFEERLVVPIEDEEPVVLGPPLRGGNWLAANNTDESPHSRNIEVFNGTVRIPMRYAIDFIRLNPDGSEFVGEFTNNADHYGYGEEILAVADGTVEAAIDGVPENVPGEDRAVPITLDTRGGNYIILDIGDGRFVTYAHMIPGSLTVRVGDQVKEGDVLGRVGNSGSSTQPHLHFHVSQIFDTQNASGLNGSALPYVFESFELLDDEDSSVGARTLAIPMNDALIVFP